MPSPPRSESPARGRGRVCIDCPLPDEEAVLGSHRRNLLPCVVAAVGLLACQAPPRTPLPQVGGDACDGLAYVFHLVGRNKDAGDTEQEQREKAAAGSTNPFSAHPDRTLRYWEQVIDYVYRRPEADAEEIRALVQEHCTVQQGRAVLLWPTAGDVTD